MPPPPTIELEGLARLEQKLLDLRMDFGLEILGKSTATSPLPFVLNISAGLPIEWALPGVTRCGVAEEALAYATNRVRAKRNGLSLLLRPR